MKVNSFRCNILNFCVVFVGTPCRSGPGNLDVFPNGESVVGDYTQGLFSALWSNEGNAIMDDQFADASTKMSLVGTIPIAPLHRIDVSDLQ